MHNHVEVWCIDLTETPAPSKSEIAVLSADERARHARYLVEEPARVFALTRIALRRLLGHRLGRSPAELPIDVDPRGKPHLRFATKLFFNVSHCERLAAIALCDAGEVGVDVELAATVTGAPPLTASIGSAAESAWLRAHPDAVGRTLARLWVRKEAILKAVGSGLSTPMASIDLGDPVAAAGVVADVASVAVRWQDLFLPASLAGAVAVAGADALELDVALKRYDR